MALQKRHKFKLDIYSLKIIDELLPKLKYSVTPTKIVNWLENFEKKDLEKLYNLLYTFEFITFQEMEFRFENLLINIFETLNPTKKALLIPYGKFGKSGSLVSYPISHSKYYKSLAERNKIEISHNIDNKDINDYDLIIFIDDFVGSGKTFCNEFKKKFEDWIGSNKIEICLLSTIIMESGKLKIEKQYDYIKVFAQERKKVFDKNFSVLKPFGDILEYKELNTKYEKFLGLKKTFSNGYENSQSLVAFSYSTPNNTLPIFWQGGNWSPLFARRSEIRMDEIKEFKKDIRFYIGICNRLGIDLFHPSESIIVPKKSKATRNIKYNNQIDFSVLAYLFLKDKNIDEIIICHILGLTDTEMKNIFDKAFKLNYLNEAKKLTPEGSVYLKSLYKKRKKNLELLIILIYSLKKIKKYMYL